MPTGPEKAPKRWELVGNSAFSGRDLWKAILGADVFEEARLADQGQMLGKYLLLCTASLNAVPAVH